MARIKTSAQMSCEAAYVVVTIAGPEKSSVVSVAIKLVTVCDVPAHTFLISGRAAFSRFASAVVVLRPPCNAASAAFPFDFVVSVVLDSGCDVLNGFTLFVLWTISVGVAAPFVTFRAAFSTLSVDVTSRFVVFDTFCSTWFVVAARNAHPGSSRKSSRPCSVDSTRTATRRERSLVIFGTICFFTPRRRSASQSSATTASETSATVSLRAWLRQ